MIFFVNLACFMFLWCACGVCEADSSEREMKRDEDRRGSSLANFVDSF